MARSNSTVMATTAGHTGAITSLAWVSERQVRATKRDACKAYYPRVYELLNQRRAGPGLMFVSELSLLKEVHVYELLN